MGILKHYWERLFSRRSQPAKADVRPAIDAENLEREISAISHESQVLADEVHRFRADADHAREEEGRKLADLESINQQLAAAREADEKIIHTLERRLAVIEGERQQANERIEALEQSQTEATNRLEETGRQMTDLEVRSEEQAKQFKASLSSASRRLDQTFGQITQLDTRLKRERQDYLDTFNGILGRLNKQDARLKWTLVAASFALVLGTVVGAVLVWDVQKNADMLASMSSDIKSLMNSMNGPRSKNRMAPPLKPAPALSAAPPVATPAAPGIPAGRDPGASAETTTPSTTRPDVVTDALIVDRVTNRQVKKPFQRKDANSFFEQNARIDGVISLDSGAQYRVIKPGSGTSPSASDSVVLHYVGTRLDGTVIDDTYTEGLPMALSMGEVLPVWREVLQKMEEGAEFELYIPANLATRNSTRKRSITGFEPHMYLIELIQVVKGGAADQAEAVN
ncbi:MAG: FKBP-type peptidyl-prolyl cis-trans isomerase [Gammaproteobacteria bacterium]